jgi:hypothetical protein
MSERLGAVEEVAALEPSVASRGALVRVRQAFFAIALLIAAIVAWGFWETYYSRLAQRADLPSIVHLHAAVFSVWVIVLVAQAAAVVAGNVRLHRRLGIWGMIYGALVFAVGLLVSVGAPALRVRASFYPLEVGGAAVPAALAVADPCDGRRRSRDAPARARHPDRQRRAARRGVLQGAAIRSARVARHRRGAPAPICLSSSPCSMISHASGPRGGRRRPERSTSSRSTL